MLMGISVMPMAMYFFFYATKVAKTETFMMVSSFLPFITYAIERTFSFFGLLDIGSISSGDFIAGGLIVAGAMYMIYMRHLHKHLPAIRAMRRKAVKEEKEASKSDYSMLCDTLEFCNGSHKDTARLLGISVEEVEAVHAGEGKRKFETGTGMKIGRNYHRHVASADALTHLSKREVLMQGLNGSIRNDEPCSLLFIDLDKFKPVNDTYGHEAGNELLKLVADVLVRAAPKGAIVARIGGDEFAIMIRKPTERSVMALKSKIKKNLLSPLKLESMAEAVHIGASIGVANFPEDAQTIKELMSIADSRMYSEKEER
jgi:diguanylate cyclase (GGDEF)-like protein